MLVTAVIENDIMWTFKFWKV